MNGFNPGAGDVGRLTVGGITLLLALSAPLAACGGDSTPAPEPTSMPTAAPQESDAPGPTPPPGDCWGGVLSADPLHCYALEEAQRDGVLVVEGIYLAGEELQIYVSMVSDTIVYRDLPGVFRANAREFAVRHPDRVT